MASLVRIATYLRAVLAPHIALQLVDQRRLRAPHDIERDGMMGVGVTTEAANLETKVARVERVTERGATAAPAP